MVSHLAQFFFISTPALAYMMINVARAHVGDFSAMKQRAAHALLLIATTSSSTTSPALAINSRAGSLKFTYGGENMSWKAKLRLSTFFQGDRVWAQTRRPEIKVSERQFRRGGVIAVLGSRAITLYKMGPSNPAEHSSQRLPMDADCRKAWWAKTQSYRRD